MIYQSYFSIIKNGHAISIILTYSNKEQKKELEKVINSIIFI